jgi:eukaryotic-like serine/threonine-protein kinase
MQVNSDSHLKPRELKDYARGRLDSSAFHRVAAHLRVCDTCRKNIPPMSETVGSRPGLPILPKLEKVPTALREHPKYRVMKVLGKGGMGTVYLAQHRIMDRLVALKVINPAVLRHPTALGRFIAEVKAASRLSHPNIVAALDADQAGELRFLVMEYVEGVNLADYLKKKGPLPIELACHLISQTADGLQHAHERKMIHRDVKPSNLMLTRTGRVKILDFGLVRLLDDPAASGLTRRGGTLGTPEYMAPEQSRDATLADGRADVYSLGCTLYCLLTGDPPFIGDKAMVLRLVRDPEPIRNRRPEVPETLEAVVSRMISPEPDQRFQTPGEVGRALAPFVGKWARAKSKTGSTPDVGLSSPPGSTPDTGMSNPTKVKPGSTPDARSTDTTNQNPPK